ncbi:tpr repeat-containing protein [Leptolyngbya sp. Heron Island J]|uniref:trypsin-like peptidase domain-containing protein n=1 Tax=Leptolyngbya sp. Heron Island J TaxID=1385935 RepID=UPI0003B9E571|nr:trypsin-like peptidase domain-containing protein [Leptolyngbya sp. Heron Island J]ESA36563.1 tpr repeat-containing protein [Leptolyngbya sp. Heron Island J]
MTELEGLLKACTVKLTVPGKRHWGTGFFVAPGYIVTCEHLVRSGKSTDLEVRWGDQLDFATAKVELQLPKYDIALLSFITRQPLKNPHPCVWFGDNPKSRDEFYLFAYPDKNFPDGCPVTPLNEGLTGGNPPEIKFADGQIREGMSGAPLLNQRTGMFCGMLKFTRGASSNAGGGGIPVSVLREQLPKEIINAQCDFHKQDLRWKSLLLTEKTNSELFRNRRSTTIANVITIPPALDLWQPRKIIQTKGLYRLLKLSRSKIIGVQGIAGVGKSWLAAHIYEKDLNFLGKAWLDVRQSPSFTVFCESMLRAISDENSQSVLAKDTTEQINLVIKALRHERYLIVIDNMENLFFPNTDEWQDDSYRIFFSRWIEEGKNTTFLVTTQIKPPLFNFQTLKIDWYYLNGLDTEIGAQFLKQMGVRSHDNANLSRMSESLDGNPLMLRLAGGFISQYYDGDLNKAEDELGLINFENLIDNVDGEFQQIENKPSFLLKKHLHRLSIDLLKLIKRLAAYRVPFSEEAVILSSLEEQEVKRWAKKFREKYLKETYSKLDLGYPMMESKQTIEELLRKSLIIKNQDGRYELQPSLRKYIELKFGVSHKAHWRAVRYYLAIYKEAVIHSDDIEVLREYPEIAYHYNQLNQADEALKLLLESSYSDFLKYHGYYKIQIELYEPLLIRSHRRENAISQGKKKFPTLILNLGDAYCNTERYEDALDITKAFFELIGSNKNKHYKSQMLQTNGHIQYVWGRYDEALESIQSSLEIAEEIDSLYVKILCLNTLASIANSHAEHEKSLEYSQKATNEFVKYQTELEGGGNVSKQKREDFEFTKTIIPYVYVSTGRAYLISCQVNKAIPYFEKALKTCRENSDQRMQILCLLVLRQAYLIKGNLGQVRQCRLMIQEILRKSEINLRAMLGAKNRRFLKEIFGDQRSASSDILGAGFALSQKISFFETEPFGFVDLLDITGQKLGWWLCRWIQFLTLETDKNRFK